MFPWQAAPSPEPTTATYRRKISLGRPHGRQPPVGGQNFNKTAETDSQWATSQTSYGGHAESWLGKRFSAVARVRVSLSVPCCSCFAKHQRKRHGLVLRKCSVVHARIDAGSFCSVRTKTLSLLSTLGDNY